MDKHGQLTIFDYFKKEPLKMPEFDDSILNGIKGLDEIMNRLPRYKVHFKKPVYDLPYYAKAKICVYVGYFHSLDGWSYRNEEVEVWDFIGDYPKGMPVAFPEKDMPFRKECNQFCDVEYGSRICFERRGALWDESKNMPKLEDDSDVIEYKGHRECDIHVDGMFILAKRWRNIDK